MQATATAQPSIDLVEHLALLAAKILPVPAKAYRDPPSLLWGGKPYGRKWRREQSHLYAPSPLACQMVCLARASLSPPRPKGVSIGRINRDPGWIGLRVDTSPKTASNPADACWNEHIRCCFRDLHCTRISRLVNTSRNSNTFVNSSVSGYTSRFPSMCTSPTRLLHTTRDLIKNHNLVDNWRGGETPAPESSLSLPPFVAEARRELLKVDGLKPSRLQKAADHRLAHCKRRSPLLDTASTKTLKRGWDVYILTTNC